MFLPIQAPVLRVGPEPDSSHKEAGVHTQFKARASAQEGTAPHGHIWMDTAHRLRLEAFSCNNVR